jgi:hypothetical protein
MIEILKDPMFWLCMLEALFKTIIVVGILWFVYLVGYTSGQIDLKKEFAKTPCAKYNEVTGKFEIIKKDYK